MASISGTELCRICRSTVRVTVDHDSQKGELLVGYIRRDVTCPQCGGIVSVRIPYRKRQRGQQR